LSGVVVVSSRCCQIASSLTLRMRLGIRAVQTM
jgi:hypothetical protein